MHDRSKAQFKGAVKKQLKEFLVDVLAEYWDEAEYDSTLPPPYNYEKYWRSFGGDVDAAVHDVKLYLLQKLERNERRVERSNVLTRG